jgi:predicted site-specific integrase-resolvase
MNEYLRPKQVCDILNTTPRTISQWRRDGKIKYITTKGGQYRYSIQDIITPKKNTNQKNYCYCRVSTRGQYDDLQRQVEFFQSRYPNHTIIRDIGSGLNFKRKGLKTILDEAIRGNIKEIVVTHKDRLSRFGFDLFESIITQYSNGQIVVLDRKETSPQEELVSDLLSIITVFSSRLYGLRSHTIKKEIQTTENSKDIKRKVTSNKGRGGETPIDDGTISLVL